MITVAILINGQPIMARSAVNVSSNESGVCEYRVDDGSIIKHRREDGAVPLAIDLLRTLKPVK